MYYLLLLFFHW